MKTGQDSARESIRARALVVRGLRGRRIGHERGYGVARGEGVRQRTIEQAVDVLAILRGNIFAHPCGCVSLPLGSALSHDGLLIVQTTWPMVSRLRRHAQ